MVFTYRCYNILTLGTDTELTTPDAKARGYVELGVATLVTAPRAFVDTISDPGDGPNLATMGMSAELEIDTSSLNTIQVVGLMIEHNGVGFVE